MFLRSGCIRYNFKQIYVHSFVHRQQCIRCLQYIVHIKNTYNIYNIYNIHHTVIIIIIICYYHHQPYSNNKNVVLLLCTVWLWVLRLWFLRCEVAGAWIRAQPCDWDLVIEIWCGRGSKNLRFSFKIHLKSIDFESRAGSGAAGDRKINDFLLNSF